MRSFFSELWQFLSTILTYWQAYAGGLLAVAIGLLERLTKWRLTLRAYAGLFFVGFMFTAFFMAWRDEHLATLQVRQELQAERERKEPKLRGTINQIAAYSTERGTEIFLQLVVRNDGASTLVDAGALHIRGEGINYDLWPHTFLEGLKGYDKSGKLAAQFLPSDAFYERAAEKPLDPDGRLVGWLRYVAENADNEPLMTKGVQYAVDFSDKTGKVSQATYTATGVRGQPRIYYPGGGNPFVTESPPVKKTP